ncbi:hypothetical protein [Burkholderia ubonensis]|uniref:hypothetical protein n=1 Tax=Burkholderia ubonensis TaxID=101571 RepID=UPI0012F8F467|nr:hypothetical protein [Burkholderia ubonensis]
MRIHSTHTLAEAVQTKFSNSDVSKKTLGKISSKIDSIVNSMPEFARQSLLDAIQKADGIKGSKAQAKIKSILSDGLTKISNQSKNHKNDSASCATQIQLVNMSVKNALKFQSVLPDTIRRISSSVGEIATLGQTDTTYSGPVLDLLTSAFKKAKEGKITELESQVNDFMKRVGLAPEPTSRDAMSSDTRL